MYARTRRVVKLAEFCITVYCVEWFPERYPHPPLHDGPWHLCPPFTLKILESAVSSNQLTEEAYDSKLLYPPEHLRYQTCLHSPMKLLPVYVHILALCVHSSKHPASGSLNGCDRSSLDHCGQQVACYGQGYKPPL